jgi:hypothetical protein
MSPMRKIANGSDLIAELQAALTRLDVAEHNFVPDRKQIHIEDARESFLIVQDYFETMTLSQIERAEAMIGLRELERRLQFAL